MTDKQIIIDGYDVSGCEWIREVGLDSEYICTCNSPNKTSGYCKYNPNCCYKKLKAKEQECERFKKDLLQNFEEKDKLHLIIDRLLEASGYNTNTASAEDFEDVYENMRYEKQQLDQLKKENEELREFQKLLDGQMKFNKSEFELSLSSEIKRSEFLLKEFKKADKQRDNWREKAKKLKQALQQIKEIAEVEIECKAYEIKHDCFNETRCKALNEHIDFTKQILQKCVVLNDG